MKDTEVHNMKTFDSSGYIRKKYRQFMIRIDREKDPDVIQKLETEQNLTAYLRDLVKEDLNNGKEKERL